MLTRSITNLTRKSTIDVCAIKLSSSNFSTNETNEVKPKAVVKKSVSTEGKKKAKTSKNSSKDTGDLDNVLKFYETIQKILKYLLSTILN